MSQENDNQNSVTQPVVPIRRHISVYFFLTFLSVLLAAATVLLAVIPQRVLRIQYGRFGFLCSQLAAAALLSALGFSQLSLILLGMAALVAIFVEAEAHGATLMGAATAAIASASGLAILGAWYYFKKKGLGLQTVVETYIRPAVKQLLAVNPGLPVDEAGLIQQIPAALIILTILAVALGLIAERRLTTSVGLFWNNRTREIELVNFRAPDALVWLTIVSIFGAFYQHGIQALTIVSTNAINVLTVIYFFQGLAVGVMAFRVFRVAKIWRVFWYVVLILQLFLAVALLGFADYWLDFRQRLTRMEKKSVESNQRLTK